NAAIVDLRARIAGAAPGTDTKPLQEQLSQRLAELAQRQERRSQIQQQLQAVGGGYSSRVETLSRRYPERRKRHQFLPVPNCGLDHRARNNLCVCCVSILIHARLLREATWAHGSKFGHLSGLQVSGVQVVGIEHSRKSFRRSIEPCRLVSVRSCRCEAHP